MSFSKPYRVLALALAFALCGVPQLFAQTAAAQAQQTQPAQPQQPNMTGDPSLGPIEPAQSSPSTDQSGGQQPAQTPADQTLPSAPSATPSSNQTSNQTTNQPSPNLTNTQPSDQSSTNQADTQTATPPPAPATPATKLQEPAGTAAAGKPEAVGGAASRPAGTAIAPAKQRQVRSWLIKLGAIAAAGAALGIVYGLSKGTSPKPPGASATTTP